MGQYSNLDSRDIVAGFYPEFEANFAGSWARDLAWINPDTVHETESYRWLGAAPQMRQWVGGRQEQGFSKFSYSLTNVKYETTIPVELDDLRRDKTGQIRVKIGEAAMEAGRHDEALITALMLTASAAGPTAYDGAAFISATHSEGSSGTQLNLLGSSEVPAANVTTAAAPTAAEFAAVLLQAVGYMYGLVNDKGQAINGGARAFTIMVGTAPLYGAAVQAINLHNLANGVVANNPLMALPGVSFKVIYNPALVSVTDKFWIFRTDGKLRPFILQYETGLETQLVGAGSEEEFKNDRHLFGLKWVKAAGVGMWQHAVRVTLS